jgi:hypothetical protein
MLPQSTLSSNCSTMWLHPQQPALLAPSSKNLTKGGSLRSSFSTTSPEESLLIWLLHSQMDPSVCKLHCNSQARSCLEDCSHVVGSSRLTQRCRLDTRAGIVGVSETEWHACTSHACHECQQHPHVGLHKNWNVTTSQRVS